MSFVDGARIAGTAMQLALSVYMSTRKLSVRLSVRLSVKRVICDKTKETCANILIPHERSLS